MHTKLVITNLVDSLISYKVWSISFRSKPLNLDYIWSNRWKDKFTTIAHFKYNLDVNSCLYKILKPLSLIPTKIKKSFWLRWAVKDKIVLELCKNKNKLLILECSLLKPQDQSTQQTPKLTSIAIELKLRRIYKLAKSFPQRNRQKSI